MSVKRTGSLAAERGYSGGNLVQLTNDDERWSIGPNWSKDMCKMYFSYGEGMAKLDVATLDLSNRNITRIENDGMQFGLGEFEHSFLWATKGKSTLFFLSPNSALETHELISVDEFSKYWVYPHSKGLFIIVNDEGKEGVYLKKGNKTQQLINMKGIKNFSVSQLGDKIVFESTMNGASDIYIGDIDGTTIKNCTNSSATDNMPSISPKSDFVIFSSSRTGSYCLFKLILETNELIQLTGK